MAPPGHHRDFSYVERGFYGAQLERALAHFPRRQILVLASEGLVLDPDATLARVTDFLGVAAFGGKITARRSHVGREMHPDLHPTAADVALLRGLYAADQALFSDLAGSG
jgi:hypothetical protein